MAVKLILLLGKAPELPLKWIRVNDHGQNLASGNASSYPALVSENYLQPGDEIYAFLPGDLTTYRLIPSPPKGRASFKSAAKYLLEDSLAEDIENVHIATSVKDFRSQDGSNETQMGLCLAVAKSIMDQWHDCFAKMDLYPKVLSADFLALPICDTRHDKDCVVIYSDGEMVMVNHHQGGFTAPRDLAQNLLPSVLELWSPDQIEIYENSDEHSLIEQNDACDNIIHQEVDLNILSDLIVKTLQSSTLVPNFLTGAYTRKINWQASLQPWRGAGIAALLLVGIFFVNVIAQSVRTSRNTERFVQLSTQIHQNAFPEASDINAVIHARKVLSTQSRSVGFLSLWQAIGSAIEDQEGIQIDAINFAGPGQEVRLVINMDSYEALEIFKVKLGNKGFRAQEGRINQNRNGQFTGELRVQL